MPRIPQSLFHQATRRSRLLLPLLRICKTLESAQLELKWIKNELPKSQWKSACIQRGQGLPLQYILGSQPFGELDIKCTPGVLIPRWETEEWTIRMVKLLAGLRLKSVDVCTGSGCIALLIQKRLGGEVKGADISDSAISLSKENNIRNSLDVEFIKRDVFSWHCEEQYDLVTSNPPYIPHGDYESTEIDRSVMLFEPKLALVGWNEFYDALVNNVVIPSNSEGFVFELGYREQYEFTKSILPSNWECKLYKDGSGKERCVIGWVKGGRLEQLQHM